jgi:hypothetical protein
MSNPLSPANLATIRGHLALGIVTYDDACALIREVDRLTTELATVEARWLAIVNGNRAGTMRDAAELVVRETAELRARLVVAECSPLSAKVYHHLCGHGAQTTAQLCAALGLKRCHIGNVTKPLILSGRVERVAHGVYQAVKHG